MKKGIAIRTILLLIIGVLVAGIVIYLVYKHASGTLISEAECNSRLTEICTLCKNNNWSGFAHDGGFWDIVDDCATYPKFLAFSCPPAANCADCSELVNPCKIFGVE